MESSSFLLVFQMDNIICPIKETQQNTRHGRSIYSSLRTCDFYFLLNKMVQHMVEIELQNFRGHDNTSNAYIPLVPTYPWLKLSFHHHFAAYKMPLSPVIHKIRVLRSSFTITFPRKHEQERKPYLGIVSYYHWASTKCLFCNIPFMLTLQITSPFYLHHEQTGRCKRSA